MSYAVIVTLTLGMVSLLLHVAPSEVELSRRNNHWDALRASISTTE